MTSKTHHKVIVVLKLPTHVPDVVKEGRAIVAAMTAAKASFPAPTPALAQVSADLDALEAAETATKTKAKGTVEARNAARDKVEKALHQLSAYVQQLVDAADPAQAEGLVASASMSVKKSTAAAKHDFELHEGDVSGSVHAVAKAVAHRAAYKWQSSTDGGKTWSEGPTTLQANAHFTGLPVGATVLVRYMPVTKDGAGDWSAPASLVVK